MNLMEKRITNPLFKFTRGDVKTGVRLVFCEFFIKT